ELLVGGNPLEHRLAHPVLLVSVLCRNDSDGGYENRPRSSRFSTLPLGFFGMASTNSTRLGFLYPARLSRQREMISWGVAVIPGLRPTAALTFTPQCSSGVPMTATSATAGCW